MAALSVPAAMAYAEVAGLPLSAGCCCGLLLPVLAYAFLGSSPRVVIGPEGPSHCWSPARWLPLAASDPAEYTSLAAALSIAVGVIFLAARLARLGWIARSSKRPRRSPRPPARPSSRDWAASASACGTLTTITSAEVSPPEPETAVRIRNGSRCLGLQSSALRTRTARPDDQKAEPATSMWRRRCQSSRSWRPKHVPPWEQVLRHGRNRDAGGHCCSRISCPTTSFCAGVDGGGRLLTADPASATWPVTATDIGTPRSVSCGTPTFCAVVDSGWRAMSYTNGSWGSRVAPSAGSATAINAVSCASASFCLSGSGYTTTPRTIDGGVTWEIQNNSGVNYPGQINAVSCAAGGDATTGFCVVVDSSNAAFVSSNGGVTFTRPAPAERRHRRGVRAHLRVLHVLDGLRRGRQRGTGLLLPGRGSGGTDWTAVNADLGRQLTSVSCAPGSPAGTTFCAAVDSGGYQIESTDGGVTWTAPSRITRHRGDGTAARDLLPHGVVLRRDRQRRQRLHGSAPVAARELRHGTHGRPRTGPGRPDPALRCADSGVIWTGVTPTVVHRWQSNVPAGGTWADVAGANARTYTPVAADVGHRLRCVATATNGGGGTDAYSAATARVLAAAVPAAGPSTRRPVDPPAGETPGPGRRPVGPRRGAREDAGKQDTRRARARRPLHRLGRAGPRGHAVRDPAPHQRRMDDDRRRRHGRRGHDLLGLQPAHPDAPRRRATGSSCRRSTATRRRASGGRSACPRAAGRARLTPTTEGSAASLPGVSCAPRRGGTPRRRGPCRSPAPRLRGCRPRRRRLVEIHRGVSGAAGDDGRERGDHLGARRRVVAAQRTVGR